MAVLGLAGASVAVLLALLTGMTVVVAGWVAFACVIVLFAAATWDYASSLRAWRRSTPTMTRRLPAAFAVGARRPVHLAITTEGAQTWHCELHDHADANLLAAHTALMVDAEPDRLGIELVNRYHAMKRAGMI